MGAAGGDTEVRQHDGRGRDLEGACEPGWGHADDAPAARVGGGSVVDGEVGGIDDDTTGQLQRIDGASEVLHGGDVEVPADVSVGMCRQVVEQVLELEVADLDVFDIDSDPGREGVECADSANSGRTTRDIRKGKPPRALFGAGGSDGIRRAGRIPSRIH